LPGFRNVPCLSAPQISGEAGSTKEVRYQANYEQNEEDEKANSGNLSRSKSHNSKTKEIG